MTHKDRALYLFSEHFHCSQVAHAVDVLEEIIRERAEE